MSIKQIIGIILLSIFYISLYSVVGYILYEIYRDDFDMFLPVSGVLGILVAGVLGYVLVLGD